MFTKQLDSQKVLEVAQPIVSMCLEAARKLYELLDQAPELIKNQSRSEEVIGVISNELKSVTPAGTNIINFYDRNMLSGASTTCECVSVSVPSLGTLVLNGAPHNNEAITISFPSESWYVFDNKRRILFQSDSLPDNGINEKTANQISKIISQVLGCLQGAAMELEWKQFKK